MTKSLKSCILHLLFNIIIIWRTNIIFHDLTLKDIYKVFIFYFLNLTFVLASISFASLIFLFFSFLQQSLNSLFLVNNFEFILWYNIFLSKVNDLSLETIYSLGLCFHNFNHSLDMNDDFIKHWVFIVKLFHRFLFIDLQNLLLDSDSTSLVLLFLFLHVVWDHVLQRWFRFDVSNLLKSSDGYVFELVF